MSLRTSSFLVVLFLVSWIAPHAVSAAIHAHELLDHRHEHAHGHASHGLAFHAGEHEHAPPSLDREMAPPSRPGKAGPSLQVLAAVLPEAIVAAPASGYVSRLTFPDRTGPPDGPSLHVLLCSYLI